MVSIIKLKQNWNYLEYIVQYINASDMQQNPDVDISLYRKIVYKINQYKIRGESNLISKQMYNSLSTIRNGICIFK